MIKNTIPITPITMNISIRVKSQPKNDNPIINPIKTNIKPNVFLPELMCFAFFNILINVYFN